RRHRVRLETGRSQGAAPIARARIEGEGEHRFALTAEQRVWARSDPRLVTTPPARTADGWAVCSARTRSSAGSTRNPVRSLTSPRNIEGHEDHEEDLFLFLPRRSVQLISPSSTRIFFVSFVLFVIFVAGAAIQRPS